MTFSEKTDFETTPKFIDHILQNVEKNLNDLLTENKMNRCLGFIDLTSLDPTDTVQKIETMTDRVNTFRSTFQDLNAPAGICVYPNFVSTVKNRLEDKSVRIASVAGCFPASQSFPEVKELEAKMAVENGADEIDFVMPLNKFLAKDTNATAEEIKRIKQAIGDRKLKVIIENGLLPSIEMISEASFLAMESGADFIKTSTGKAVQSATPTAAIVMCSAIRQFYEKTGKKVGFKAAGGIATPEEAIAYYTIVELILGEEWLTPEYFRIGASRLANNLLSKIRNEKICHF